MDNRTLLLILVLDNMISGSPIEGVNVTCLRQTLCALRETKVELKCSYSDTGVTPGFWFSPKQKAKWRDEKQPEDLALDSDYAGRVSYTTTDSSTALQISDLRERDSGEYQLLFITETGEKHVASAAVNLTVADLQVRTISDNTGRPKALTCWTSCPLTSAAPQQYYWYRDGQYLDDFKDYSNPFPLSSDDKGSYSCSVPGFNEVLSPPVCISVNKCWGVSYAERRVCVLEGSTVDINCTYSHPTYATVTKTYWFHDVRKDLRTNLQFAGRVKFTDQKQGHSSLEIRNVKTTDAGEYRFYFKTHSNRYFGKAGVVLQVTGLQVVVSLGSATGRTLSCISTCSLPNELTYVWYKDGRLVTNTSAQHNKLYLNCSEHRAKYTCAIRGREELQSHPVTVSHGCADGPDKSLMLKYVTVGLAVVITLVLIAGAVWMWRRKSKWAVRHMSSGESAQDKDDVHYSSVHFAPNAAQVQSLHKDLSEKEHTEYSALNFKTHT